ncbi:sugar ABC transporter substrate-binding protein [Streptomyces fragilis]|uniref:Substrate-binding domain-containing protein n=1 Tax=Streptomyces fragilis TaxID=67301 RepID=A0ABV2YPF9_9ACTN|nr:substrate-binding domain-containing protein [Streptomyces fragilis]
MAAVTLSFSLAACGGAQGKDGDDAAPSDLNDITIGLLMPEKKISRYEAFDFPIFKDKVEELTDGQGVVRYANADGDQDTQNRQMRSMVDAKVDVIVVDAVDAAAVAPEVKYAKEAGVPVIAYDRLAEGPVDAYVSFNNTVVGEVQGRSLAEAVPGGSIVMINGSPTDPNAKMFRDGARIELNGQSVKEYDTEGWDPEKAKKHMKDAIEALGVSKIDGVLSANDGMAGGVVEALKEAGVTDMPPITGQDADIEAVRRIVTGEQYMTVYKPYPNEAEAAAEMAVAKVRSHDIQFDALTRDSVDSPTKKDIPAALVPVIELTRDNIKDTVVADGIHKVDDICVAEIREACKAAKLL